MKKVLLIFLLVTMGLYADTYLSTADKEVICNKAGIIDCKNIRDEVINKWIENSDLGNAIKITASESNFIMMYQVYKTDLNKKKISEKYNNSEHQSIEFIGAFIMFFIMIYFLFSFFRRPVL